MAQVAEGCSYTPTFCSQAKAWEKRSRLLIILAASTLGSAESLPGHNTHNCVLGNLMV